MPTRNILALCLLALSWCVTARATDPPAKQFFVPAETFEVDGRPAFVMLPAKELRKTPQPWIWYCPTLPGYPDEHEKWMDEQFVAAGIAVAGIDVGESFGSPAGNKIFDQFYNEMVQKRGFKAKPCLLGRSRGGLMASSWAVEHPECVAGLAGIYPVFDFRTYPGIDKAAPAYGLAADQLAARSAEFNPIERIDALAKAHVPVFIIHGDVDAVVPLEANSAELARRYAAAGQADAVQLVVVKGQGHNFWQGFFRCQQLVDFAIAHAR
ncbi:MAG TPA: prolyl oligopeptidase family serine peptidase [Pirellulales bacterium]|jgi:dipeptidyl aminopeptidase/acylaminoacyl peptidase|nr:prolyl oligopeptidase family serine peptidase [Pirellulales bacterium]